jgi:ABC-type multidrug transport system ATPase subunit
MAQKLAFALARTGNPPILLLDEPTASLDSATRERVLSILGALKDAGTTILLSTHSQRGGLTMANRAVAVEEGRIVAVLQEDRRYVDARA